MYKIKKSIHRFFFYSLWLVFTAFNCYLAELFFYEIFLGGFSSHYRSYELIIAILAFLLIAIFSVIASLKFVNYRFLKVKVLICCVVIPVSFVGVLSFTNLAIFLGFPLLVEPQVSKGDVIIVANKGSFPMRGGYAAELFHRGVSKKMVVFVPKAEPYISFLKFELDIPDSSIIWARDGHNNTRIEAQKSKVLIDQNKWTNPIFVTGAVHMRRLKMSLDKLGVTRKSLAPVPIERYSNTPCRFLSWKYQAFWHLTLGDLDFYNVFKFRHRFAIVVFHEFAGIVFYKIKGFA